MPKSKKKSSSKTEDKIEKKISEAITRNAPKILDALIPTILFPIVYLLLNKYYRDIKLFNENFRDILPLINFSFLAGFVLSFTRLFFWNDKYKRITTIASNLIFLYVNYHVWNIFPFDTSVIGNPKTWDTVFRVLMVIVTVASIFGTFAELVRLMTPKEEEKK
ncbi:hypothetical protein JW710_02155 [Candidatus Dojkabacteria bacterium]|nr:hypothetical protein [Candidatus Dojkabacteria bacterium]